MLAGGLKKRPVGLVVRRRLKRHSTTAISAFVQLTPCLAKHHLASIKSLGVTARGVAFHPSQPHERKESFLLKPAFAALRSEDLHNVTDLVLASFLVEWNEHGRLSQIAIVFRDFILQYQMGSNRFRRYSPKQPLTPMALLP